MRLAKVGSRRRTFLMPSLLELLAVDHPIIQAPMAGTASPAMAAEVANAGALGSLGVAAMDAVGARAAIAAVRERSPRSLNVNVFCHPPARPDAAVEAAWIERLRPEFQRFDAAPPRALREITGPFSTTTRCSRRFSPRSLGS